MQLICIFVLKTATFTIFELTFSCLPLDKRSNGCILYSSKYSIELKYGKGVSTYYEDEILRRKEQREHRNRGY